MKLIPLTQPGQQAGQEAQDARRDEPQEVIIPAGGDEDLLLAAHAFLAAVAGRRENRAPGADRFAAFVAAQGGLDAGMVGAVQGSGFRHGYMPIDGFWFIWAVRLR